MRYFDITNEQTEPGLAPPRVRALDGKTKAIGMKDGRVAQATIAFAAVEAGLWSRRRA